MLQTQSNTISAQEIERRLSAIYDMLWGVAAQQRKQQLDADNSTEHVTDNVITLTQPSPKKEAA